MTCTYTVGQFGGTGFGLKSRPVPPFPVGFFQPPQRSNSCDRGRGPESPVATAQAVPQAIPSRAHGQDL